ncbi:MAG: ribosome-associated translation inhibitor RaiA [Bifidobacteriaceae bacterium]|jgi:ribosomal subunit interface protein|nr:ribosome-associated translation inhibitor RaiA [Bifidobacteriaceae bacterium]
MEITVTGRHTEVPERFRSHTIEKLSKLDKLNARFQRVAVEVIHERNPRRSGEAERIEITAYGKGPVLRAEAAAPDRAAALDLALAKMRERARRATDRRKTRHKAMRRSTVPVDLGAATPAAPGPDQASEPTATPPDGVAIEKALGDSPVIIREKVHSAVPMTVEDAIYEMELVGHPFFLFVDKESHLPSVLYHRHGWTYGVIRLRTAEAVA